MSMCTGALSAQLQRRHRFSRLPIPRYTGYAELMMKRTLFFLGFFFLSSSRLLAQDHARASVQAPAPDVVQPAYGAKLHIDGIPNAGKITDALYRGAQPKKRRVAKLT